jgi:transposase-like protein
MTRKNHAKRVGDLTRTATCPFCGGEHRRKSAEARECRKRARAGKPPLEPPPPKESQPARRGSPTTLYENDPLRGDKRAHLIARLARQGWPTRKIAKRVSVSVSEVNEVLERIG